MPQWILKFPGYRWTWIKLTRRISYKELLVTLVTVNHQSVDQMVLKHVIFNKISQIVQGYHHCPFKISSSFKSNNRPLKMISAFTKVAINISSTNDINIP